MKRGRFQATLVWYARNASLSRLQNMFQRAKGLFENKFKGTSAAVSEVNAGDILNYRTTLGAVDEYKLGAVAGFIEQWHAMGYAGISDDTVHQLRQLRLKRKSERCRRRDTTSDQRPVHRFGS